MQKQIHTWSCIYAGRLPVWWPARLSWCSSGCPVSASSRTGRPSPCGPGWSGRAAPTGATAGPPGRKRSPAGCGAPSSPLSWARCTGRCRWFGWSPCGWRRTGRLQRERGDKNGWLIPAFMCYSAICCWKHVAVRGTASQNFGFVPCWFFRFARLLLCTATAAQQFPSG